MMRVISRLATNILAEMSVMQYTPALLTVATHQLIIHQDSLPLLRLLMITCVTSFHICTYRPSVEAYIPGIALELVFS